MQIRYKNTLVIAVCVVLGALIVSFNPTVSSDNKTFDTRQNLAMVAAGLSLYQQIYGRFPATGQGLASLLGNNNQDPVMTKLPLDGWSQSLIYHHPAKCQTDKPYDLYSSGENRLDECMRGDDIVH